MRTTAYQKYLSAEETGLQFDIEKSENFGRYRAKHHTGHLEDLKTSDVISAHILFELKKANQNILNNEQ